MLNFESDYIEGAHPAILEALVKTNMEALSGYGFDCYTERAKEKIKAACGRPDAEVFFVAGGTQTNALALDSLLDCVEGAVAAETGHIACHEGGAIEHSGHKVLTLPQHDGKMDAGELRAYLTRFHADGSCEHMVQPGLVYVTHPTEYGTLYAKAELEAIAGVAHEFGLPLYLDGARLGYGLMARGTDLSLEDIAEICDVLYIGGTKVGALLGEALVFTRGGAPSHFLTRTKQHGALLAKGRVLGLQFDTLFTDGLYFSIAKNAIDRAEELKALFREKGYPLFKDSPTNQQFVILTKAQEEKLKDKVQYCFWEQLDEDRTVVRFATSWATTKEKIAELAKFL